MTDDRDILITRVMDGEASPEDWTAFRALAESDPGLWSELAARQQDHAELEAAILDAIAVADRVEAPIREHAAEQFSITIKRVGTWAGWAVAAAVTLAWGLHGQANPTIGDPALGNNTAALGPQLAPPSGPVVNSPAEALDAYLTLGQSAGRVVGMSPDLVVLESRPAETGEGIEVVYLRQIIEREVITGDRVKRDERGFPIAAPAREPVRSLGSF